MKYAHYVAQYGPAMLRDVIAFITTELPCEGIGHLQDLEQLAQIMEGVKPLDASESAEEKYPWPE
jgi:hypothetical protein